MSHCSRVYVVSLVPNGASELSTIPNIESDCSAGPRPWIEEIAAMRLTAVGETVAGVGMPRGSRYNGGINNRKGDLRGLTVKRWDPKPRIQILRDREFTTRPEVQ